MYFSFFFINHLMQTEIVLPQRQRQWLSSKEPALQYKEWQCYEFFKEPMSSGHIQEP